MWETISSSDEISQFMEKVYYFHDSCIKEMNYISGAYVEDSLWMHPLNDRRILRVIIQRQFAEDSMIELEFQGLKYLKLFPCGRILHLRNFRFGNAAEGRQHILVRLRRCVRR